MTKQLNEYVNKETHVELHVLFTKDNKTYTFLLDKNTAKEMKELAEHRNWCIYKTKYKTDLRLQKDGLSYFAKRIIGIKDKQTLDLRIKNIAKQAIQKERKQKQLTEQLKEHKEKDYVLQFIILKPELIEQMYIVTRKSKSACFLTQIVSPHKVETKLAQAGKEFYLNELLIKE